MNNTKLIEEANKSIVEAIRRTIMGKDVLMVLLSAGLSGVNELVNVVKTVTHLIGYGCKVF